MIELQDICKTYQMGEVQVRALDHVSLQIAPGEFVAIMGPSGSGKSTLLHIIGLLDVPDQGSYRFNDREVSGLNDTALSRCRSEEFGFIFQQFNLLARHGALENVLLPLRYAGKVGPAERQRALALLERVGLAEWRNHQPNEMSGGQQQRVAIARALINHPSMILADEPTGNLDSKSEAEIVALLEDLNRQGITIVMVTHEESVAQRAKRVIRMRDGCVQADKRNPLAPPVSGERSSATRSTARRVLNLPMLLKQGFGSLASNKVRTALSTLGIMIGVAAVVAMLALGRGAQQEIEKQLASLGSNLLVVRPGALRVAGVALESGIVTRITADDVRSVQQLPGVKNACPSVNGRGQLTFRNRNWNTQVLGTGIEYADMRAARPQIGRFFTEEENRKRSLVAVPGLTVVRQLFGDQDPLGEVIKINKIAFRVIGILPERGATGFRDQDDVVAVPVFTAMRRLMGKDYFDSIDVEVADRSDMEGVQQSVKDLLLSRHRVPVLQQQDAFEVRNMADIQAAFSESSRTMGYLLASIAAISLVVGGIGIMNIMLVTVTERTGEIGLRKAIGARAFDILFQFLVESVVVSVFGGALGVLLGWGVTRALAQFAGWSASVSPFAVALAFGFSAMVGIIFGLYPARRASRLSPVEALRYE